jgi:hypothetical protein
MPSPSEQPAAAEHYEGQLDLARLQEENRELREALGALHESLERVAVTGSMPNVESVRNARSEAGLLLLATRGA